MKQYLDLLQNIIDNGVEKESGRDNMPNTIGISNAVIRMDLQDGFPLLTTKQMYWKGIVHELLWFLRGDTNIKYLVDNNVNIWNGDAYRWYLKQCKEWSKAKGLAYDHHLYPLEIDRFIALIKGNHSDPFFISSDYALGDLGKVYGYQWRNQNGVDQIKEVLEGLKSNPYSRYHIVDGWNKADFKDMALPPCHLLYQFIVRPLSLKDYVDRVEDNNPPKFYLDLNMYQRSCDTFLGVPFNLASMSLLLMIFAKVSNMLPGVATWIGGDTHLYVDHGEQVIEQLCRDPYPLPEMNINKKLENLSDIENLTIDDFELVDYKSHGKIKAELFSGLKK
jgi:thymidylate synthase